MYDSLWKQGPGALIQPSLVHVSSRIVAEDSTCLLAHISSNYATLELELIHERYI